MNTKVPRRYFLIPVMYILLIGALLTVEFTGTVRVQEQFANVTLSAVLTARQGGNGQGVHQVELNIGGFVLAFDRQKPLEFRLSSGRSVYAPLTGYALLPGAIEVEFGDRFRLLLHSSGGNQNRIELITDIDEPADLVMPYVTSGAVQLREHPGLPFFTMVREHRGQTTTATVALPPEAIIDAVNSAFIFRSSSGSYLDFYLTTFEENGPVSPAHWFDIQYDFPHAARYEAVLSGYIDAAYGGWTGSRYSRSNGTWSNPVGQPEFNEVILTTALSESVRRGSFDQTFALFRNGTVIHQDKLTWLSSPHIGDIVAKGSDIQDSDLQRIEDIRDAISNDDPGIFEHPDLLEFARDRAPSTLYQELADFAARVRIENLSLKTAIGMISTYLSSLDSSNPLDEAFARFRPLVDGEILSILALTDKGLVVLDGITRADIQISLLAGSVLIDLGIRERSAIYEKIGKEIITTVLALSDEEGMLPEWFAVEDRMVTNSSGTTLPEDVYPIVSGYPYYPRPVALASRASAAPVWVWTSSKNFSLKQNGSSTVLNFDYPVGGIHHFAIRGIEPFNQISFFGIQWKSDPRFQFYRTGWLYDEGIKTLFVKITHSSPTEELVIQY